MIKKFSMISTVCIAAAVLIIGFTGCAYEVADAKTVPVFAAFTQAPQIRLPTPEEAERFPQVTNLPVLYIELEYIPLEDMTRDIYVPGSYTFIFGEEGGIFNEPLTIKGRGAWSWSHNKRPYTIELFRETGWGGLPAATKWILIGNWTDKSLLRNYITLQLARRVSNDWAPNCFFADVFINGEYHGTYLITESIEIHRNRLDLDRATEAIFEIEAIRRHQCHEWCIEIVGGVHHAIFKRPRGSVLPEVRQENLAGFRELFAEMQAALSEGYEAYSQFIDVPSFVNWYIVNEFTKNFDSGFTASCYVFLKNGKLHMGPAWDFDTPFGNQNVASIDKLNPVGYHVANSPWFSRLMRDETFFRLVRERWTELRREGVFDDFLLMIDNKAEYIAESARLNFERWPCALAFTMRPPNVSVFTHEGEVEYLRNWVVLRIEWLDSVWYIEYN